MQSDSIKLSTELHREALLTPVSSSDLSEQPSSPKGLGVPRPQVNLLTKVPVKKSVTVAHKGPKLTLPGNLLHYSIKPEELACSANQDISVLMRFLTRRYPLFF